MNDDAQNLQATAFDSKIEELDKKIERSEKSLSKLKEDRDALVKARALMCGSVPTNNMKASVENMEIIHALKEYGQLHYKEIAAKVNEALSANKSEGAFYTKLDRMSKEDEAEIVNLGRGNFTLKNKQDQTKGEGHTDGGSTSVDVQS